MNRYPLWKYILILVVICIGVLYALPNIYGKDPALQISPERTVEINELVEDEVKKVLGEADINIISSELGEDNLIVRFDDEETQLRAQSVVQSALGNAFIVALNLAPATPEWLKIFGAEPMFLGLDLRGGVHFLLEVDMPAAIKTAEERYVSDFRTLLRESRIRYRTITRQSEGGLLIRFRDAESRTQGIAEIEDEYPDLELEVIDDVEGDYQVSVKLAETEIQNTQQFAIQQNLTTLRNRVNELGVAEPNIAKQGQNQIVVQLPGVQDTARAKELLKATATLEFRMLDEENSVVDALDGRVPAASKLYYERNGTPHLLRKQVMLTGDYITNASSGIDQATGGPAVFITLDGKGAKIFSTKTRDEVGKAMAVVFIENDQETVEVNGELVKRKVTREEIIQVATIREQLSKQFQITGMASTREARDLALLLRAGALAAPVQIVEERTVGPSLGQDNINKGMESIIIGMIVVMVFMALYYKVFGLAADIALVLNLVLIVALLSMLGAALTLPGIAGIVLTVGMAVDANVLIFQRIREEIRNGNSPQASIHAGYEKAFSTIMDANITTLIAAVVLFSFGTGPIKGFAVTLCFGIISSMFTAIIVTRAIVNLIYGGRKLEKVTI